LTQQLDTGPFQEVTYTDAVKLLEKSGKKFEFPVAWGLDLQKEHEKYLVEVRLAVSCSSSRSPFLTSTCACVPALPFPSSLSLITGPSS
jgi:hypothetical protein